MREGYNLAVVDEDNYLRTPNLHDDSLQEIRRCEDDGFELRFASSEGDARFLKFDGEGQPIFWGGGVVIPCIVSVAWIFSNPNLEQLALRVPQEDAARLMNSS